MTRGGMVSVPSAAAVAAEIRRRGQPIPIAKLHKLLYYVQAYHLVWEGTPAFADEIEAWTKGPVVADLWRQEKRGVVFAAGSEPPVPEMVANVVTNVLRRYGHMTGAALIAATHAEDPWLEATGDGRFAANQEITHESLIRFFSRESPEVRRMKEALAEVRPDPLPPFVPDPPGALEALMAEYSQS